MVQDGVVPRLDHARFKSFSQLCKLLLVGRSIDEIHQAVGIVFHVVEFLDHAMLIQVVAGGRLANISFRKSRACGIMVR